MVLESWWCSLELWGMTGLDAALPKMSCPEAVTVRSPCGTRDSQLSLLRNHLHKLLAEHRPRDCGGETRVSTWQRMGQALGSGRFLLSRWLSPAH